MITQELLGYIRTEFSKGKTREEIRGALISGGGWSEDDLNEAFRTIIPMPSVILPEGKPSQPAPVLSSLPLHSFSSPSSYSPSPLLLKSTSFSKISSSSHLLFSLLKFLIILIIIGGLGFGSWYYRSQIINLWDSLVNNVSNLFLPFLGTNQTPDKIIPVVNNITVQPTVNDIMNCGIGTTPKLNTPSTYENDPVLSCLGASALNCENATGILKDDFFPTIFEITKSQNSCNFKLSYPADSALIDITGKKLAGQYISCPIDIVKAMDNTNAASPKFLVPGKTDLSKYASDIYFYGTLGLFIENNLDPNKIQALGCSGEYIQSVIASYRLKHAK